MRRFRFSTHASRRRMTEGGGPFGACAVDRFARVVLGYHGCSADFAESLLSGETTLDDWKESRNPYDWLGHGIYFWEYAPERARRWAEKEMWRKRGIRGAVVGALIQLGRCLDFTDVGFSDALVGVHRNLKRAYTEAGADLPPNNKGRGIEDSTALSSTS